MRWVVLLLTVLLAGLQYRLWVGDDSLPHAWALKARLEAQKEENERLAQRNRTLEAEVIDLKTSLDAIEERARSELGLIRKGETFYQVLESPPPVGTPAPLVVPPVGSGQ